MSRTTTTTDISTPGASGTDLAVTDHDTITAILLGDQVPEYDDPEAIQRDITARLLRATSVDDLFGAQGTINSQALLGVPIEVHGCRLLKSTIEDPGAFGAYMVIDYIDLTTGVVGILTSGARNIMTQVYTAKYRGFLPVRVKIIEAGKAKPGRSAPLALTALTATDLPAGDVAATVNNA